jgi:hypothetical protein
MNQRTPVVCVTCVGFIIGIVFSFHVWFGADTLPARCVYPGADRLGQVTTRRQDRADEKSVVSQTEMLLRVGVAEIPVLKMPALGPTQPQGIPHIFHQTWNSYTVPKSIVSYVKSWHKYNPEWEYWFWRDEDNDIFVKKLYLWLLEIFHGYSGHIHADRCVPLSRFE